MACRGTSGASGSSPGDGKVLGTLGWGQGGVRMVLGRKPGNLCREVLRMRRKTLAHLRVTEPRALLTLWLRVAPLWPTCSAHLGWAEEPGRLVA